MRVALEATGKIGARAARVLLAERDVDALGLIGRRSTSGDPRISTITSLAGWDVVASDDADHVRRRYRQASDHGIPLVVATHQKTFQEADIPVVVGAGVRTGLGAALAAHECARHDNIMEVLVGWTEPGRPLRRGRPLTFPQPIGTLWAGEGARIWNNAPSGTRFLSAPFEGPWAGLVVRATAASQDGVEVRTLGVTDDENYLAGVALAAGALVAGTGAYPIGCHYPAAAASAYLETALRAGVEVASFVERR